MVPLVCVSFLLQVTRLPNNINQVACSSDRATAVCSLALAQFQLNSMLRQEGASLHQQTSQPKPITWWIDNLLEQVTSQAHMQLNLERFFLPTEQACSLHHQHIRLVRTSGMWRMMGPVRSYRGGRSIGGASGASPLCRQRRRW